MQETSYEPVRKLFEKQIAEEVLPALGFRQEAVVDLRISRFGHAMPVAAKGKIRDGTAEKIHAPLGNKVFFVHQDNWLLPAIETCLEEALFWQHPIRKAIQA